MRVIEGRAYLPGLGLTSCSVGWEGERILKVAKLVKGDEGHHRLPHDRIILPGAVDLHVHLREPGLTHKEDWRTGTVAAACGGVTTVVDMPNTLPPTDTPARLAEKLELAQAKAQVDFGLWGYGRPETPARSDWQVFEAAVTGWKVYPYGLTGVQFTAAVEGLLARSAKVVVVHAEHPDHLGLGRPVRSLTDHTANRVGAETEALRALAPHDHPRLHLAHLSTAGAVELLNRAPGEGEGSSEAEAAQSPPAGTRPWQAVCAPTGDTRTGTALLGQATAEVSPHHLLLATKMEGLGLFGKVDPPLRRRSDNGALWRALNQGLIQCVASDHAPHTPEEKESESPPSGVPGVETMVPLMLQAVRDRRWNLDRAVEALCAGPAARLGLEGVKGGLAEGCHADLMVVNVKAPRKIRADELHSRCAWTPYEGWQGCFPEAVWCRGQLVAEEGEPMGRSGDGRYLNEFWSPSIDEEAD